eukprot:scaffold86_cov338-Pavlova_lutheri.AAC.98
MHRLTAFATCGCAGCSVYAVKAHANVLEPGTIALNAIHRRGERVSSGDEVEAKRYDVGDGDGLVVVNVTLGYVTKGLKRQDELEASTLNVELRKRFTSHILTAGQSVTFEYQGTNFLFDVQSCFGEDDVSEAVRRGMVVPSTTFVFEMAPGSSIKVTGQRGGGTQLFKAKELNFEKLGIGGLDKQFDVIFRRAFASRVFPPGVVKRLGMTHVKGMLLHGPPGTGKTLIARQIGKMLNGKEPKIVNGPEVLNKYVGASEENIRNLFKDAEADQSLHGDDSELHIIIFDEIDAICKSRGSVRDGSGVHDTLVNQLLTKIDGVDALNNVLLIGMTNRKDMLDEAMLRPGRLEVHVEIGLPDEAGRQQILKIHTSKMSNNQFLGEDVDLAWLASMTKNFSGAELEGLVKSAASFGLSRQIDVNDLTAELDEENIKITKQDFLSALQEVQPAFGASTELLESFLLNGIIESGPHFTHLMNTCRSLVRQVQDSEKTPLLSCLLEGPIGAGKTAIAATLALESSFPFVKIISAESMVGFSEVAKCNHIARVFDDAYKSNLSFIVLDDIERLLEYVSIGPRFSNVVLQTLLVLVKKQPPSGRKLMVVGTTSLGHVMDQMEIAAAFNVTLTVPALQESDIHNVLTQIGAFEESDVDGAVAMLDDELPIKKLLMLLEMARQGIEDDSKIPLQRFAECLADLHG